LLQVVSCSTVALRCMPSQYFFRRSGVADYPEI
jgi:hypothetical protein